MGTKTGKRIKTGIMAALAALMLTGCGSQTASESYKQAGLGGLVMLYDDGVWTPNEEGTTETSLRFEAADNGVLGVSCSKEGMYQHPLDMIAVSRQIYSSYEGYEELEEPVKVEVNGDTWYEWSFRYQESGETVLNLQRFYGKNYYAYTVSYLSDEAGFEKNKEEAKKAMNSIVMEVPDNQEGEAKAKEFLTGEWDLGAAGYLVLGEDGTYSWFMESSKDENNMHTGTYGCDVQNEALGFSEGEGVYLVLFPERLVAGGEESVTGSAKYDYGISMEQAEDGSYPMLNASTFNMYQMKKQ